MAGPITEIPNYKNRLFPDLKKTLKFKNFLNEHIEVVMVNKDIHRGWLKSLDPLTGDMVLSSLNGSTFLMEDSVTSVKPVTPEISDTKDRLLAWFKKNGMSAVEIENGALCVDETVTINPPYHPEDCVGDNETTTNRAVKLITTLPIESSEE